jgi:hypothetical protein
LLSAFRQRYFRPVTILELDAPLRAPYPRPAEPLKTSKCSSDKGDDKRGERVHFLICFRSLGGII